MNLFIEDTGFGKELGVYNDTFCDMMNDSQFPFKFQWEFHNGYIHYGGDILSADESAEIFYFVKRVEDKCNVKFF